MSSRRPMTPCTARHGPFESPEADADSHAYPNSRRIQFHSSEGRLLLQRQDQS